FAQNARALAGFLEALYQVPAPDVGASLSAREIVPLLGVGRRFRKLGPNGMTELLRTMPMPAQDWLDDAFDNETLKAANGARVARSRPAPCRAPNQVPRLDGGGPVRARTPAGSPGPAGLRARAGERLEPNEHARSPRARV